MIHDISVIIPIKNGEELPYLASLLDDICRQSDIRYRLEIIIVASDDVKKIIDSTYHLKDRFEYVPPIQVRDVSGITASPKEGHNLTVVARNWGATCSIGDILVFFDVDNSISNLVISDMVYPIVRTEYVMTYIPPRYDEGDRKEKELKLIRYNNFLLRFDLVPKPPFAIHKEVFRDLGGLKAKNPMFDLCSRLLWKYPGGIKKIETEVLVSPRHILERAEKKTK